MGAKLSEYHTGYRAFSREILEKLNLDANSDDFVFDNQVLVSVSTPVCVFILLFLGYALVSFRSRTAEIVVAELGVALTMVDDLRELSLGEWEGRTVDEVRALPGDPYAQWLRDPLANMPPGGEPLPTVQRRALAAVDAIAAAHPDGEDVLVVAHGGVISVYLAYHLGLPLSAIWRLTLSNCSVSRVAPPRVLSLNDTAHLDGLDRGAKPPGLS